MRHICTFDVMSIFELLTLKIDQEHHDGIYLETYN